MTPYLKSKFPFLSYLKFGSIFYFIEIDLSNHVSEISLFKHRDILERRRIRRKMVKKEEDKYHINLIYYNEQDKIDINHQSSLGSYKKYKTYYDIEINNNCDDEIYDQTENIVKDSDISDTKISLISNSSYMIKSLLEGKKDVNQLLEEEKTKKKFEEYKFKNEFPDLNQIDEEEKGKENECGKGKGKKGKKGKKKFVELNI